MFSVRQFIRNVCEFMSEMRLYVNQTNERMDKLESKINLMEERSANVDKNTFSQLEKIHELLNDQKIYSLVNQTNERMDKLESKINLMEERSANVDKNTFSQLEKIHELLNNQNIWYHSYYYDVFVPNVESYIDNQISVDQGIYKQTEEYKYIKTIHEIIRPFKTENMTLRRVGRSNDGGYVMVEPYSDTKIAYSLGICDDVSWDKEMAEQGYEIYQYDHTIDKLPEENEKFHWFKIGLTGDEENEELKHLDNLLDRNGHSETTGMVLKMDIEGYEWGVINQSDESILDKFDQIVMEIHYVVTGKERNKIIDALKKITKTHAMVNIHANNNSRRKYYNGEFVTSDVLELTLLNRKKYNVIPTDIIVPNIVDEANNIYYRDLFLGRW